MQELAYGARHRGRRARRGARVGPGRPRTSFPRSSGASRSSSTPASASSKRCARCGRSRGCGTASALERYGVQDEKLRRFRYGVQVNSLGLTEAQPENNVQRIVLEMLGVTLSKDARARADPAAVLERGARPAPALGPAVVAAHAAGARLRDRPARVRRPVRGLEGRSRRRPASSSRPPRPSSQWVLDGGGVVRDDRRDEGPARAEPRRAGAAGSSRASIPVVGVNTFTETAPSPLVVGRTRAVRRTSSSSTPPPRPSRSSALAAVARRARRRGVGRARSDARPSRSRRPTRT